MSPQELGNDCWKALAPEYYQHHSSDPPGQTDPMLITDVHQIHMAMRTAYVPQSCKLLPDRLLLDHGWLLP